MLSDNFAIRTLLPITVVLLTWLEQRCGGDFENDFAAYSSSGLIVVEVHQLTAVVLAASVLVRLPLANVDEVFSEPNNHEIENWKF